MLQRDNINNIRKRNLKKTVKDMLVLFYVTIYRISRQLLVDNKFRGNGSYEI